MGLILLGIFAIAILFTVIIVTILICLFKPKELIAIITGIGVTAVSILFCYFSIMNITDPGSNYQAFKQFVFYMIGLALAPCIGTVFAILVSRIYRKIISSGYQSS
ncbi:hypothetical protein [Orbus mooreae]|uniref:hypothetical protein n=1 Tax=Orbus mooreae TaxID=3074107 RepID=UPI00370D3B26